MIGSTNNLFEDEWCSAELAWVAWEHMNSSQSLYVVKEQSHFSMAGIFSTPRDMWRFFTWVGTLRLKQRDLPIVIDMGK